MPDLKINYNWTSSSHDTYCNPSPGDEVEFCSVGAATKFTVPKVVFGKTVIDVGKDQCESAKVLETAPPGSHSFSGQEDGGGAAVQGHIDIDDSSLWLVVAARKADHLVENLFSSLTGTAEDAAEKDLKFFPKGIEHISIHVKVASVEVDFTVAGPDARVAARELADGKVTALKG